MAKRKEFPYRDKDQKALEEGERVARARYYADIRRNAHEVLEDIVENGYIDEDALTERLDEEADSYVTYTRTCLEVISNSDNWLAIEDVGIEIPSDDFTRAVCMAAYFAYRQDLYEQVEAIRDEFEG